MHPDLHRSKRLRCYVGTPARSWRMAVPGQMGAKFDTSIASSRDEQRAQRRTHRGPESTAPVVVCGLAWRVVRHLLVPSRIAAEPKGLPPRYRAQTKEQQIMGRGVRWGLKAKHGFHRQPPNRGGYQRHPREQRVQYNLPSGFDIEQCNRRTFSPPPCSNNTKRKTNNMRGARMGAAYNH